MDSNIEYYYCSSQGDAGLDLTSQGQAEVMLLPREVLSSRKA